MNPPFIQKHYLMNSKFYQKMCGLITLLRPKYFAYFMADISVSIAYKELKISGFTQCNNLYPLLKGIFNEPYTCKIRMVMEQIANNDIMQKFTSVYEQTGDNLSQYNGINFTSLQEWI